MSVAEYDLWRALDQIAHASGTTVDRAPSKERLFREAVSAAVGVRRWRNVYRMSTAFRSLNIGMLPTSVRVRARKR